MDNNNAYKIELTLQRYNAGKPAAMKAIAYIAEQFFKASFRKQEGGGKKWAPRKFNMPGKQRALLMNRGTLRNEIKGTSSANRAVIYNPLPYAEIHNEGGTITITPKMRRFFWAMYFKTMGGATSYSRSSVKGKRSTNAKSSLSKGRKLMEQALPWKLLALHKGDKLTIPSRPFIYHSSELNAKIDRYIDKFIKTLK